MRTKSKVFYASSLLIISVSLFAVQASEKSDRFPKLEGSYLGQDPPGLTAEKFDPGIFFKGEYLGCSGFLNNGTVFVFSSMKPGSDWRLKPTYVTELKSGFWTKPRIAPFSHFAPYNFTVGPDGQTLYFTTVKSPDKTTYVLLEQSNIWAVKLEMDGWTEPVMFGRSLNTEQYYENYPAVTSDGTIYYMSRREKGAGKTDIFRSRNTDGRYAEAENLGKMINTPESDQDPFIAPDESYLIICQDKPGGFGKYDLYISFKRTDGSWTTPVNMGEEVNSSAYEFRPYITPDGKYLFFTSNREETGDIFWIKAGIIERLKPNELK
ncbi:TolB family protein [Acidobacteriota bacterium]